MYKVSKTGLILWMSLSAISINTIAETASSSTSETATANADTKVSISTALMEAIKQGSLDKVKEIIKKDPDAVNRSFKAGPEEYLLDEYLPLGFASSMGRTDIVKELIDNKASVNEKGIYGKTALMWAASGGRTEIVKLLIDHKASVNEKDNKGRTALDYAKEKQRTEIINLLTN